MACEQDVVYWWQTEGAKLLNSQLIELRNQDIGCVPLSNLIDIKYKDKESLTTLLKILATDGIRVPSSLIDNEIYIKLKK